MSQSIVVVMDDIAGIAAYKDTTFAMLLEAQRRGLTVLYAEQPDLSLRGGQAVARLRQLAVRDDSRDWFDLGPATVRPLGEGDVVLMRKDPPVDADYINTTYLLEQAERAGARVVNRPAGLRDLNEKLSIALYPDLIAPTLVSSRAEEIREFVSSVGQAVLKPLDGMGGRGIFKTGREDANLNVIIETLTAEGRHLLMAQGWLDAIADGDKRVLLIDGEPVDYLLARIPGDRDFRGNLARGGRGVGRRLEQADREIARRVGPMLRERGIAFAGIDIIGDRLTEINVTSPTCVRELDEAFGINIAGDLFDAIGV